MKLQFSSRDFRDFQTKPFAEDKMSEENISIIKCGLVTKSSCEGYLLSEIFYAKPKFAERSASPPSINLSKMVFKRFYEEKFRMSIFLRLS